MTREQLIARYPRCSESFIRANLSFEDTRTSPLLESNPRHAPLDAKEVQGSTGQKFLVRIKSIRKRLLDESNLCEKYHEDLCRYAGILPSDAPEFCHTEVSQRKTLKGEAEHVVIEVYQQTT